MDSNYDEDLSENIFFQSLQKDYYELFQKATLEGWVICIPRAGSLPSYALSHNDFFNHILIPSDELPETHFRTLNEKDVKVFNRIITVEADDISSPFNTHILFEETYYTEDLLKYKVWCIENTLGNDSVTSRGQSGIINVSTLRDCIDLLWTESCKEVLEQIDEIISNFLTLNEDLEFKPLQIQRDLVGGLYTQCLQIALKDTRLREKTNLNSHLLENVKVSIESYMHHGIYKKLIKGITTCRAYDDACFNKVIRNLTDIQLRDLDISPEYQDTVPKARSELSKIEGYSTVMGKVGCIQRTVTAISKCGVNSKALSADDLLPMLVFLVIKSGLPNWIAHLTYMKDFNYSFSSFYSNKQSFLITSLEAAIEHIRNGLFLGPLEPESQISDDTDTNNATVFNLSLERENNESNSLSQIFDLIKLGNCEDVQRLLRDQKTDPIGSLEKLNLCHPLCSCDKCEQAIGLMMCNTAPTVNSCDDRGFTVLHIAAMCGRPKIVDMLLTLGADPNVSDYKGSTPLHYAAGRGHQNALLLLAHAGSKITALDNEGNAALHFAASNGHEDCVKALIYFAEYNGVSFDVNCCNNVGDTALHNACRWGYENIVSLLLEYGADPLLKNKRKMSSVDYAHNLYISKILRSHINRKISCVNQKDITVAAAQKTRLDLEELKKTSVGVRPNSTAQIKKLDRLFSSIMHGDINLAMFYLGLETTPNKSKCHPLCNCKKETGDIPDSSFGDSKCNDSLSVNVCDADGFTPLHMAAKYGRADLVTLLLKSGADANIKTQNSRLTPLQVACEARTSKCAESILLHSECDINSQDSIGNTALHYACQTANIKLVEMLLKYGPKLNIKNYQGATPLGVAKKIMSLTLVNLLSKLEKKHIEPI